MENGIVHLLHTLKSIVLKTFGNENFFSQVYRFPVLFYVSAKAYFFINKQANKKRFCRSTACR